MTTVLSYLIKRKFLVIYIFLFFILTFSFNSVRAYSLLDDSTDALNLNKTLQSVFNRNPFQFSPIDITPFFKKDSSGLSFNDLVNIQSFSFNDLGASAQALLVLFIRLIITTLNVTLGILKVLLDILTTRL